MINSFHLISKKTVQKFGSLCFSFFFLFLQLHPTSVFAAYVYKTPLGLPAPGTIVDLSSDYTPAMIKGVEIDSQDPLKFTFYVYRGDERLEGSSLTLESEKCVKYFLASLTVPEGAMWVNLAPGQKDRIIGHGFGETEMGRDLLAEDYLLKQLTASLFHPENPLGAKFWDRVYAQAKGKYDVDSIPFDLLSKVWIVPDKAVVYEEEQRAFVIERHLKVMTDAEYHLKEAQETRESLSMDEEGVKINIQLLKEIIIPAIEQEINYGENFANLRQIYNSMILATWYKMKFRETLLSKIYVDQNKTAGVETEDKEINQKIYTEYEKAFKNGVYNYIQKRYDPQTREIVNRKYLSGGFVGVDQGLVSIKKTGTELTLAEVRETLGWGSSNMVKLVVSLLESTKKKNNTEFVRKANVRPLVYYYPLVANTNDLSMATQEDQPPQILEQEILDAFDQVMTDLVLWYAGSDPNNLFRSGWHLNLEQYFPNDNKSAYKANQLAVIMKKQFPELQHANYGPTSFDLDYVDGSDERGNALSRKLFNLSLQLNHRVLGRKVKGIKVREIIEFLLLEDKVKVEKVRSLISQMTIAHRAIEAIPLEVEASRYLQIMENALIRTGGFSQSEIDNYREKMILGVVDIPGMKEALIDRTFVEPRQYVQEVIQAEREGSLQVFRLFELIKKIKGGTLNLTTPDGNYFWGRSVTMNLPSVLRRSLDHGDEIYYENQKKRLLQQVYNRLDQRRDMASKGNIEDLGTLSTTEALEYAKYRLRQNGNALRKEIEDTVEGKNIDRYLELRIEIKNAFGHRLLPKEQQTYNRMISFLDNLDIDMMNLIQESRIYKRLQGAVDNLDEIFMVRVNGIQSVEDGYGWTDHYYKVDAMGIAGTAEAGRWEGPSSVRRMPEAIGNTYPAVVTSFEQKQGEIFPTVTFSIHSGEIAMRRAEFKKAERENTIVDVEVLDVDHMRSREPNAFQVRWVAPSGEIYEEFVPPHFIPRKILDSENMYSYRGKTLQAVPVWDDKLEKGSFRIQEELDEEQQRLYAEILDDIEKQRSIEVQAVEVAVNKKTENPSGIRVVYQGLQGFIPAPYMPKNFIYKSIKQLDREYVGLTLRVQVVEFDPLNPRRFILRMLAQDVAQREKDDLHASIERAKLRELESQQAIERVNQMNKPEISIFGEVLRRELDKKFAQTPDVSMATQIAPGGIDFHSKYLDLQIKRDGKGVALPISQQTIESMDVEGFLPVILEMSPAYNLPSVLGIK